jgi:hypothetical protein
MPRDHGSDWALSRDRLSLLKQTPTKVRVKLIL